jgi:hypothetical protein
MRFLPIAIFIYIFVQVCCSADTVDDNESIMKSLREYNDSKGKRTSLSDHQVN